MERTFC